MKQIKPQMGTVVTVEIVDAGADQAAFDKVFAYFAAVENRFSPFKESSEIFRINQGLEPDQWSSEMKTVFALSEQTKKETGGYFDIVANNGKYNPSGLVKGWAINSAAKILSALGYKNFYVNAGGDIQVQGRNASGERWSVGIKNPFKQEEIVKVVYLSDQGIATSGIYIRGQHIYNPLDRDKPIEEIISLTVIGPNVYEADRFATAAFAMGTKGIIFMENLPGFESYMIDKTGRATFTSGFEKYLVK
jgi:thiamine biosynthesis lipoprotein